MCCSQISHVSGDDTEVIISTANSIGVAPRAPAPVAPKAAAARRERCGRPVVATSTASSTTIATAAATVTSAIVIAPTASYSPIAAMVVFSPVAAAIAASVVPVSPISPMPALYDDYLSRRGVPLLPRFLLAILVALRGWQAILVMTSH